MDQRLTRGRLSAWTAELAHTLWNDRHPVVMVSESVASHISIWMVSDSIVLAQGSQSRQSGILPKSLWYHRALTGLGITKLGKTS
jgi:hypothetical protein